MIAPGKMAGGTAGGTEMGGVMPSSLLVLMLLWSAGCAGMAEMRPYLGAECEKAGYTPGTSEHKGCMKAKYMQTMGPMMQAPRQRTTCYQYGNMMQCN
jgi:hypothetical protein